MHLGRARVVARHVFGDFGYASAVKIVGAEPLNTIATILVVSCVYVDTHVASAVIPPFLALATCRCTPSVSDRAMEAIPSMSERVSAAPRVAAELFERYAAELIERVAAELLERVAAESFERVAAEPHTESQHTRTRILTPQAYCSTCAYPSTYPIAMPAGSS